MTGKDAPPEVDFRRSVFAGHRNIFFRPESGVYSLPASQPIQS